MHLLDAKALIAAFDEEHSDHAATRAFVDSLAAFYTTPQTQGAFLRFFSRPWTDNAGVRHPPRLSASETMELLKGILALPEHRFLPDDISFTEVSMKSLSGFKQWNDAYLIALARKHNLKLCTLERKLDNMDDASDPILVLIR
jgi:uncharacterized protein